MATAILYVLPNIVNIGGGVVAFAYVGAGTVGVGVVIVGAVTTAGVVVSTVGFTFPFFEIRFACTFPCERFFVPVSRFYRPQGLPTIQRTSLPPYTFHNSWISPHQSMLHSRNRVLPSGTTSLAGF
jgi:hypothetical protein